VCAPACLRVGSERDGVFVGCCACVGSIRARTIEYTRDRCRMSSIIRQGDTYHGISVFGRGVFTNDQYGRRTYAGQCKDGHACGLGVTTLADGDKVYAEHGPDGKYDGRRLARWADGNTGYSVLERGEQKDWAAVFAGGSCKYNGEACAPDDPRVLALIAQVAPVEVRPAAPASRHSDPKQSSDARFAPRRRSRRPSPPRCTADCRAAQANNSRSATRDRAVTRPIAGSR
jgi:hypothetical protein